MNIKKKESINTVQSSLQKYQPLWVTLYFYLFAVYIASHVYWLKNLFIQSEYVVILQKQIKDIFAVCYDQFSKFKNN